MTDAAVGDMPIEPVPPIPPPGPESTAEVEAASPEAAPAEAPADRAAPFDVEHLGPLRRAVLDALLDTEEPQSVAQILAAMPPGTSRGSGESAIKREFDAGRIMRTSPGHYALAPARPPGAKPAAPPEPDKSEDEWVAAIELWVIDPESWSREALGPRPDEPGRRIPSAIVAKAVDRSRKREARRQDRDAAAVRQAEADATLLSQLIGATGGNLIRGPGIEDVAPIKLALQVVPIDRILSSIRNKTDRKMYPKNEPASSWGERRLLKAIAEDYCGSVLVPRLVAAWEAAGKAPATKAQSSLPAGDMPDDIIDRSRHDDEHAPAGPHSLVQPDAAPDVPQEAAGASEPPATVETSPEPERAPAAPPAQSNGHPGSAETTSPDTIAEPASDPPEAAAPPGAVGRAQVLAAFARNRTPPSPQPAPPRPATPQPRPVVRQVERPPERQPISREGWEELVSGYVAGNVNWNVKRLGAPPGDPNCRAPRDLLRSFGL
jgi:hypothetical protein